MLDFKNLKLLNAEKNIIFFYKTIQKQAVLQETLFRYVRRLQNLQNLKSYIVETFLKDLIQGIIYFTLVISQDHKIDFYIFEL